MQWGQTFHPLCSSLWNSDSNVEGGHQRLSTADFMAEAFMSKTAKSHVGIKRKRDDSISRECTDSRPSTSKFENVYCLP